MFDDPRSKADSERVRGGRRPVPTWMAAFTGLLVVASVAAGCSSSSTTATTTSKAPSSSSTTTAGLSAAAVRILQAGLAKVGCYTGKVDGVSGPLTTKAVRAFQTASGLPADGVYGSATKAKLLAAENAGNRVCSTTPASTTTTSSGAATTTTAPAFPGVPSAAVTAIASFETAHGPAAGSWQITSATLSTVDPSYVYFKIGPAPGHESTVQGGYGFAHDQGGGWTVVGFGTSGVGCPPNNAQNELVPTGVLSEFGVSCPATT
jgi:peptidoglycan hydrolase-like protein with peptidoglycan-binding domain